MSVSRNGRLRRLADHEIRWSAYEAAIPPRQGKGHSASACPTIGRMSSSPVLQLSRDRFRAARTREFTESVIREMTRLAYQHNAVNLAQGYPDFPAPAELKRAAIAAIEENNNQYSITWGAKPFRQAIS